MPLLQGFQLLHMQPVGVAGAGACIGTWGFEGFSTATLRARPNPLN